MAQYTKALTIEEAYDIGWENLQAGQWILNTGGGLGRFVCARLSPNRGRPPRDKWDAYESVWVVWASCYAGEGFGSRATEQFNGLCRSQRS